MSIVKGLAPAAPGFLVVASLTALAWVLGSKVPWVGPSVFGLALGIAAGNLWSGAGKWKRAYDFASKTVLQAAIVLLGFGFSLSLVLSTAAAALPLMVVTILGTLAGAHFVGRSLGVSGELRSLIGAGTAICGGSAIAAVSAVIDSKDEDISYAVSVIFLYNLVGVLVFPFLGRLLGMSQEGFGLWAGTAINDTSSVVAAGYLFGSEAGDRAVVVKLARTLMIIPLCLGFSWSEIRRKRAETTLAGKAAEGKIAQRVPWGRVFPLFLLGFVAASCANSLGLVPRPAQVALATCGKVFIAAALAAIGLKTDFRKIAGAGPRPLFLGGILSLGLAALSLALQFAFAPAP